MSHSINILSIQIDTKIHELNIHCSTASNCPSFHRCCAVIRYSEILLLKVLAQSMYIGHTTNHSCCKLWLNYLKMLAVQVTDSLYESIKEKTSLLMMNHIFG